MAFGNGIGYTVKIDNISTGTVTSVGLSAPSIFSVAGTPITGSGILALSLVSQTANRVFAAPNGSTGAPTFRALVAADIPALPYGTGTVTSVGLSAPSIFSVAGTPITGSGILALSLVSQTANRVFAAPNGSTGAPTFRALVAADIPALPYGTGTVTSVGLSAPSIFSVAGTPITGSGVLALSLVSQSANTVFAAPNGSAGAPTFRALVAADFAGAGFISGAGTTNYLAKYTGTNTAAISRIFDNGTYAALGTTDNFQGANGFNVRGNFAMTFDASDGILFIADYAGTKNVFQSYNSKPIIFNLLANNVGIGTPTAPEKLTVVGNIMGTNFKSNSGIPSITLGAGAGSGSSVLISGNNNAGTITITIGTGTIGNSILFTLTPNSFVAPAGFTLVLMPISFEGRNFTDVCQYLSSAANVQAYTGTIPPISGADIKLNYFLFPY